MRTIIAFAAALGFLVAVSAQTSAQSTGKPTAEQCKADPKLRGCPTLKATAEQCAADPKLKGCAKRKAATAPAPK